jgi:integral membrane protein
VTAETPVNGTLNRYRVMAFITGSFLLLLTAVTLVKYIGIAFDWEHEGFLSLATVIGIVHGWIFIVYVAACAFLWMRMKWPFGRLVTMVLGGVVPGMSFVMERRISREVAASLNP